MNYTLVKPDGTLGQTRDFDEAPTLAHNKGKWLPDNPPDFNPATHIRERGPQSVNAAAIAYIVTARPLSEVRAEWDRYWARFDAVQAATTVEQVNAVVW